MIVCGYRFVRPHGWAVVNKYSIYGLILLLLALPAITLAQTNSENWGNGISGNSDWEIAVGLLAIDWPEFQGSDASETIALPYIDLLYRQRFFINDRYGIGAFLYGTERSRYGASLAFREGRDESGAGYLEGTGDIDSAATLNLFASYLYGSTSFDINLEGPVTGDNTGLQLELILANSHVLAQKFVINPGVIARLASERYMDSFYGVSTSQATSSELPVYETAAGLKSLALELGLAYLVSNRWMLVGGIELERLLGDAADSPITRDKDQLTATAGLAYRF